MTASVAFACLDVSKEFPTRSGPVLALNGVRFEVYSGEFLAVVGPSGCGKTTLLRLLAGLDVPSHGEIYFQDRLIQGPGRERGMVFQAYSSFPWLRVKDNVRWSLRGRNTRGAKSSGRECDRWLELVGLLEFSDHFPSQLSGGMQQRLALARTLAANPEVLLLDEPLGALDLVTREILQEDLRGIHTNLEKTTVLVTHDVEEAIFLSDRILVLTPRPGSVAREVPVTLGDRRPTTLRESQEFLTQSRSLIRYLREMDEVPTRTQSGTFRSAGAGGSVAPTESPEEKT